MLGLNKHIVKLLPYNENWEIVFSKTHINLRKELGQMVIDIQHVGSTSIPGIPAKPILDIAVLVGNLTVLQECITRLAGIGFEYRGDSGKDGGHLFVKCIEKDVRTHHIHLIEKGDSQWKNYLHFRDKLRSDIHLAREYTRLKKRLEKKYPNDRLSYTNGKHNFIRKVLDSP